MVWAGRRDKGEDSGGLELMPLEMMRSVKVAGKQELHLRVSFSAEEVKDEIKKKNHSGKEEGQTAGSGKQVSFHTLYPG